MPLFNAFSKTVTRDFTIPELEQAARLMRGYDLVALCAAGSGHAGGTLSMMDIVAALYLKVANHDPNVPEWPDRDRIVWSGGHKAPALYLGLAFAGYFPIEDVVTLRKLYSPFQGHPHRLKLPGVEASTGSLGPGAQHRSRHRTRQQARRAQEHRCSASWATASSRKAIFGKR